MPIPQEILNKINDLQTQIWQTVSLTVSEASNQAIQFGNALTVEVPIQELFNEMTGEKVIIEFAFAGLPENTQIAILSSETFLELASTIKGEPVTSPDENLIADIRVTLEAIVQGLCLSASNIKNEPISASGLSIRIQKFNLPSNLQGATDLIRVTSALSSNELNGTLTWLLDNQTAHYLLGLPSTEEGAPFEEAEIAGSRENRPTSLEKNIYENNQNLQLLFDIPLEISVELGRVKLLVKEVIELGTGSIIEIDKAAGEPVDIMINGKQVAKGEVVVVEDNFGVRVTEIIDPRERLGKLNEVA